MPVSDCFGFLHQRHVCIHPKTCLYLNTQRGIMPILRLTSWMHVQVDHRSTAHHIQGGWLPALHSWLCTLHPWRNAGACSGYPRCDLPLQIGSQLLACLPEEVDCKHAAADVVGAPLSRLWSRIPIMSTASESKHGGSRLRVVSSATAVSHRRRRRPCSLLPAVLLSTFLHWRGDSAHGFPISYY